jgi:hypothetical protein
MSDQHADRRPPRQVQYGGRSYSVSEAHPAADKLPWHLDRPEFAEIVADMQTFGYDPERPIVRDARTGRIIAGRRRELAAQVAGRQPVYRDVHLSEERIIEFVRREELLRRNLDVSARAAVAVELADLLPAHRPATKPGNVAGLSQATIAEQAKVSERTVRSAAKVKRQAPELLAAVKDGKLSAHTASRVADLPADERQRVADADDPKQAAKEAIGSGRTPAPPRRPVEKTDEQQILDLISQLTRRLTIHANQPKGKLFVDNLRRCQLTWIEHRDIRVRDPKTGQMRQLPKRFIALLTLRHIFRVSYQGKSLTPKQLQEAIANGEIPAEVWGDEGQTC